MKTLIYDAAPHHVLVVDDDEVHGGEEFAVSEQRAVELLADPYANVRASGGDLSKLSRQKLNEIAEQAGVDSPADLDNKDAVIAAIEQAAERAPQTPPAADGEGQENAQEA